MNIPHYISKEIYLKDNNQLQIDVIEIAKFELFNVKRVYLLSTNENSHLSGKHAHLNQSQIFLLVNGKAQMRLIDAHKKEYQFSLERKGLFVPEAHWVELTLEPFSTVLCLASKSFDELISINKLDEFLGSNAR